MNILEEAQSLVEGARREAYGHPYDDFKAVTGAAQALGICPGQWEDPVANAQHHALYMVLVKIQRLVQTPGHRDSIVDGAGYFYTYEKVS